MRGQGRGVRDEERGRRDEGGRGSGVVGWVGRRRVLDVVAISNTMTLVVHHHESVYAMV